MAIPNSAFSDRGHALIRTFRTAFHALAEHKSDAERAQIIEVIASHLRSTAPLAFGGIPDTGPMQRMVLKPPIRGDVGDGSFYELSLLERWIVLYVHDSAEHDADLKLTRECAVELRNAIDDVITASGAK